MGLLDDTTHRDYYLGNNLGSYQFTSLDDVITQFEIAYVGENKLISKIKRADISFFAQRAMQELSFDTFKSVKSHQIDVPATLTMVLPHDYVNYTKLSWVDSAGIKHPLYYTKHTNNPFQISQEDDGTYEFNFKAEEVIDGDFALGNFSAWQKNPDVAPPGLGPFATSQISSDKLVFSHRTRQNYNTINTVPHNWGHVMCVWQELDVSDKEYVTLSGSGAAVDFDADGAGILRLGLSTTAPDPNTNNFESTAAGHVPSPNTNIDIFDLQTDAGDDSYIEWSTAGNNTTERYLEKINVQNINTIYVVVVSFHNFTGINKTLTETNNIDDISVRNWTFNDYLKAKKGNEINSSTWNSYKSTTPSENNNDDYEDDTYWPHEGRRYGLEPSHAQINGSFYIDDRLGKIHFSSDVNGKTVILDYISDSLGTDKEMKVHKFAEEALYKWIAYGILSSRANVPEYIVQRFKKEKFAETRKAKLRLSNIKLEEITQILRGKSKQIKH